MAAGARLAAPSQRGQAHHRDGTYSGTGPPVAQPLPPDVAQCWRCGHDLIQEEDGSWRVAWGDGLTSAWPALPPPVAEPEARAGFIRRAPWMCGNQVTSHSPWIT